MLQKFKTFILENSNQIIDDSLVEQAKQYILKIEKIGLTYLSIVRDFSPEEFRFLINVAKISLNKSFKGYTFLHALAFNLVYPELLKEALHQDTVNSKNFLPESFLNTPLHLIIVNEHYKNAVLFVNGANEKQMAIDYSVQDQEGKTTLVLSSKMRATSMVIFIIDNIPPDKRQEILNIQDENGNTALHYAMLLGDVNSAQKLIEFGAKIDVANRDEKTPLDLLANSNQIFIKKILGSVSIDPERDEKALKNNICTDIGSMPFVFNLAKKITQEIKISAVKNDITKNKLINLCEKEIIHEKRLYESFKIDLNELKSDYKLMTDDEKKQQFVDLYALFSGKSLKEACLAGRAKLVAQYTPGNLSMFYGSEINIAFRRSAADGNLPAIRHYLNNGADIESQSKNGKTALDWAGEHNHTECYDFLLFKTQEQKGEDYNKKIEEELNASEEKVENKLNCR